MSDLTKRINANYETITALTEQCAALVRERDELQKKVQQYEKRSWQGLTDEEVRNEAKNHVFDESFFSGAIWARWKILGKNNG